MQNFTKSSLPRKVGSTVNCWLVEWLPKNWHTFNAWHLFLMPLSTIFRVIITIRKYLYRIGVLKSFSLPVPVVVVGNINVGGTGKTPLVIYLVEKLRALGLNPGVISRGYGAKNIRVKAVDVDDSAALVGDEPLLIKRRLKCPVYVHADRVLAGKKLIEENPLCDIIVSDDGLQHYRLQRQYEIVVIDGKTGFGNEALLPAGPLREPIGRLKSIDAIVTNGMYAGGYAFSKAYGSKVFEMSLNSEKFYNLKNNSLVSDAKDFYGKKIVAIAGIGNPKRFFHQLETLKLTFKTRIFPDHHAFAAQDFAKIRADVILMTEKDAVKCGAFAHDNFWVLPVSASLDEDFMMLLLDTLDSME
jgi:tetraacyldisaccharide 4'-kinase